MQDELVLLLGEIRPFFRHDHAQELVLQTVERDHEVDQRHLGAQLGGVVRVAEFGGDVKLELLVVLDDGVPELDAEQTSLLERLLQQQRLETRV